MPPLLLAALLAFGLVLTGCSNDAEPAAGSPRPMGPPQDPAPAESTRSWVEDYCRALTPVGDPPAPPEISREDLTGSRERMLAFLDGRVASVEQAQGALGAVGPAPTQAGQSVLEPASRLLRERLAGLSAAADRLRAVPAVAEATLLDALQRARGELVLADPGAVLADLGLPPDLQQTATTVAPCRPLLP